MSHWIPNRAKARRNIHQAALTLHADVPGQERRPDDGLQEIEIQAAIMRLLKVHPQVAWVERINVGGGVLLNGEDAKTLRAACALARAAKFIEAGRMIARLFVGRFLRFAFKGCPDIIGQLKDGRFLGIEVKRLGGTVSADQMHVLARINEFNGVAFVARDPEDVITHLKRRIAS